MMLMRSIAGDKPGRHLSLLTSGYLVGRSRSWPAFSLIHTLLTSPMTWDEWSYIKHGLSLISFNNCMNINNNFVVRHLYKLELSDFRNEER